MKVIGWCKGQYPEGCGARLAEHKHILNQTLMTGLRAAAQFGHRPFHLHQELAKEIGQSATDNFQKLQYWGLVVKHPKLGYWEVTNRGFWFLEGIDTQPEEVWTFRGEVVRRGARVIGIEEVRHRTRKRPDWAQEALPHLVEPQ